MSTNSRRRQMCKLTRLRKNGKVHRRRAFFLFFYVFANNVCSTSMISSWSEDRYPTNNIPIATADFTLHTSVTIYVSNYRTLPMRIEPVGVFIIERLILDNRARLSSFLHPLFYRAYCTFLLGKEREEAGATIIYYYLWRFAEPADFPPGKRICLCSRLVQLIPSTTPFPVLLKINQLVARDFHVLF